MFLGFTYITELVFNLTIFSPFPPFFNCLNRCAVALLPLDGDIVLVLLNVCNWASKTCLSSFYIYDLVDWDSFGETASLINKHSSDVVHTNLVHLPTLRPRPKWKVVFSLSTPVHKSSPVSSELLHTLSIKTYQCIRAVHLHIKHQNSFCKRMVDNKWSCSKNSFLNFLNVKHKDRALNNL